MLPDRVSNPGPLTYESGALPIALRGPTPFENMAGKDGGVLSTLNLNYGTLLPFTSFFYLRTFFPV